MDDKTSRRDFFEGAARVAVGGAAAAALGGTALGLSRPTRASALTTATPAGPQVSPEARLRELGIELAPATAPVATYVPTVTVGNVLYVAGHTPRMPDGSARYRGKVGDDFTLEQGREAAEYVGTRILATLRANIGSLNRVVRLVRTFGMVNASPDFTEHPQVINGFSDLMVQVFGEEAGKGTRAAVGMGSLPGGMAVEIETYWEIRD